jgi:hypothetical protein
VQDNSNVWLRRSTCIGILISRQDLRFKDPAIQPIDLPNQSSATIFNGKHLDCTVGPDHEHIQTRPWRLDRHARQGVKAAEGVGTITGTILSRKVNLRSTIEMSLG